MFEGAGNVFNMPVPRGMNDSGMAMIREELILPRVAGFRPDAIVLLCGADTVEEDPLSHLHLSNNAAWDVLRGLRQMAKRLLVLGGGGYNPWSVGRLWTGVWGILNDEVIPDRLPPDAEAVLSALKFEGNRRGRNPPEHWFTTLQDPPREGPVDDQIHSRLMELNERSLTAR